MNGLGIRWDAGHGVVKCHQWALPTPLQATDPNFTQIALKNYLGVPISELTESSHSGQRGKWSELTSSDLLVTDGG